MLCQPAGDAMFLYRRPCRHVHNQEVQLLPVTYNIHSSSMDLGGKKTQEVKTQYKRAEHTHMYTQKNNINQCTKKSVKREVNIYIYKINMI